MANIYNQTVYSAAGEVNQVKSKKSWICVESA